MQTGTAAFPAGSGGIVNDVAWHRNPMTDRLTEADVSRLLSNSSAQVRAQTAVKIATEFDGGALTLHERLIAEDIIRKMVKDAEVLVREALSNHLKECDELPHDIAASLARDVDAVALPMLQFSDVLTDADLVEIVRTQSPMKQMAVAQRETVSSELADALVKTEREDIVAAVVSNEGADLSERSLQKALDKFGSSDAVKSPMVRRGRLPITVAERLVTLVSEAMQEYLVTHHELAGAVASDLILQSRERATMKLLSEESDELDVERLVGQLKANGRLTPTIILRALCMGDIAFFEASLATLAEVPITNARMLIHDEGSLGLEALYDKANLPKILFPAMRTAIEVLRETDFDCGPNDRDRYKCRVLERILTQFESIGTIGSDNLDYLMSKLGKLGAAAA